MTFRLVAILDALFQSPGVEQGRSGRLILKLGTLAGAKSFYNDKYMILL